MLNSPEKKRVATVTLARVATEPSFKEQMGLNKIQRNAFRVGRHLGLKRAEPRLLS